jgi:hypothetical protein
MIQRHTMTSARPSREERHPSDGRASPCDHKRDRQSAALTIRGTTEVHFTHEALVPEYECFDACSKSGDDRCVSNSVIRRCLLNGRFARKRTRLADFMSIRPSEEMRM